MATSFSDNVGAGNGRNVDKGTIIPLINLPDLTASQDTMGIAANQVAGALKTSGFLLVKSNHLTWDLQQRAIECTTNVLTASSSSVITHPTDPKKYMMLGSFDEIKEKCASSSSDSIDSTTSQTLIDYWNALEYVKKQVLVCMAIGLKLPQDYFVNMHEQNNSALRLLHYPKPKRKTSSEPDPTDLADGEAEEAQSEPKQQKEDQQIIIRCKPHSDYGSITLLLTDGVPGLQALIDDNWISVPYVRGALVVNIGSLLSEWTKGTLLATLHRVVGYENDENKPRTSLAFFADPDQDISAALKTTSEQDDDITKFTKTMSVAEYIQWRSGGTGTDRSGVDFTDDERNRAGNAT